MFGLAWYVNGIGVHGKSVQMHPNKQCIAESFWCRCSIGKHLRWAWLHGHYLPYWKERLKQYHSETRSDE